MENPGKGDDKPLRTATFANGILITTYPVPPASFDFEKATDEERTLYGIPRLPAGSTDVQQRRLETLRNIRLAEPVFKQRDLRRKKLPGIKPGHGTETYSDWSGA